MLRISHCLDNRLTDGDKVDSPTHQPRSTPQKHYFSASVKLHNKELHDLYFSPNIIRMVKSRRMRWSVRVARTEEKMDAYRLLV
jgi:hypothetical protein